MNRRRFLHGVLALLAIAGALLVGLRRWLGEWRKRDSAPPDAAASRDASGGEGGGRGASADAPLRDRLRTRLDYLQIDDEVLSRFVADLAADPRSAGRDEQDDGLATRLLLSTDFFQNGADEARPLRYVAYYEPYASPCYNPLAEFD